MWCVWGGGGGGILGVGDVQVQHVPSKTRVNGLTT